MQSVTSLTDCATPRFLLCSKSVTALPCGRFCSTEVRSHFQQILSLVKKEAPKLRPLFEAGSGTVQEKQIAYLRDIIDQLTTIFGSEPMENDLLSFIQAIRSKMLESDALRGQAEANTREQFASSPDHVQ